MAFFSKKLTPTEARYHVTDREFMAIFKADRLVYRLLLQEV